jgi:hypothetical protein
VPEIASRPQASASITAALFAMLWLPSPVHAQDQPDRGESLKWRLYVNPFGTRVDYPAFIFSVPSGATEKGSGERFRSADRRAQMSIYALANDGGDTPASYLTKNLKVSRGALDYNRVAGNFFAISGVREGQVYYSRCNFPSGSEGAIHCVDLVYPERETKAWDAVVTRISRSLRPL